MAKKELLITAVACATSLAACASKIQTTGNQDTLAGASNDRQQAGGLSSPCPSEKSAAISGSGEGMDLQSEEAVSDGCLAAWRKALKGDKAGAMKDLQALEKQYPKQTTVHFMMAQVLEHAGDKAGAIKFYREAAERAQFSSMYILKLAEALRTSGDARGAIVQYRKLVAVHPTFSEAKIGLARALLDAKERAEAKELIDQVLRMEPENAQARDLLKNINANS
jgi:tetratricopeptide (TPR) repeat protein